VSLWTTRDEPVLRHFAEHAPQYNILWTRSRSDEPRPELPGVSEREFHRSVITLSDAGYLAYGLVEPDGGGGCNFQDSRSPARGSRPSGSGPCSTSSGRPPTWQSSLTRSARRRHRGGTDEPRAHGRRGPALCPGGHTGRASRWHRRLCPCSPRPVARDQEVCAGSGLTALLRLEGTSEVQSCHLAGVS
jgi:hypothetical protein